MQIALLPTGKAELLGFQRALERLFPGHEFHTIAKNDIEQRPFDGFTSASLSTLSPSTVPTNLDKIIERAASELVPGRNREGPPIDLLIITEDLELANLDQPQAVTDAVRNAVNRHIEKMGRERSRHLANQVSKAFREHASFHLLVPMLESWFFADPDATTRAGVPLNRLPRLVQNCDPEGFETDDPEYINDTAAHCSAWLALPQRKRKKFKPGWLKRGNQRIYHPKDYLSWLCRSQEEKNCTRYRETREGKEALEELNWVAALRTRTHCKYMRSFLSDIEWTLNQNLNFLHGDCAPLTDISQRPADHVFRNI